MKKIILFILLIIGFVIISCKTKSINNDIIGKWIRFSEYNYGQKQYVSFDKNGIYKIKDLFFLHTKLSTFSSKMFDSLAVFKYKYIIDSVDEIGGIYYRTLDMENNDLIKRKYAIIDNPFLFDCGIKPVPKDDNYIYLPSVFIKDSTHINNKLKQYHSYSFIFSDTLSEGEYYIYYNKLSGKSNIKKENSKLVITNKGINEINEFFDIRYFALRKYKAFIKSAKKSIEIPVVFDNWDLNILEYTEKKDFIDKLCPTPDSKCIIVNKLNPGRSNFIREFGRGLKGGNILDIEYISKKNLFKQFDRRYYGTSN